MTPELLLFYQKLVNKQNFSLVRFGDGEHNIMDNVACNRKGFDFDPKDARDQEFKRDLREAFKFKSPRYYKGLDYTNIEENIVYACLFVNNSYLDFLDNFSPLFENCIFVGNELGMDWQLPFKPQKYIRIKENAWKDYNSNLLNLFLSNYLTNKNNEIVLVAGGPMSNVLIYKLYKNNPNNTYINVGSVFDPHIFGFLTRKYQERLCT
ncbi:MAG: hypothetical protein M0R03_13155 [Novosphingobium sp.]|nr:hypothetical protein [Novosphingobium sp.]